MTEQRKIEIPLSEILDLVACAEDYGFADDVLLCSLAEWCNKSVSDDEIKNFSTALGNKDGYSEEDAEIVSERLTAWRDKYCK